MSSKKFEPPLYLERRPSRGLERFLWLVHGAAVIALLGTPLPVAAKAALLLLIGLSLHRGLGDQALLNSPRAIVRAAWAADGGWRLETVGGQALSARLAPSTFVHPRLIILNFVLEVSRQRAVVLLPDALDLETARRLRVALRLRGIESRVEE